MRKTILLSFIATAALTGCGEIGDFTSVGQEAIAYFDSNAQLARENFHNADADGDGTLTKSEYVNWRFNQIRFAVAPSPSMVKSLKSGFGKTFDRLDRNGDGLLTLQELGGKNPQTQILPHPYTGLKVLAINALPLRCPCFVMLAEAQDNSVRVEFSMGYGGDESAVVRHIDKVMVNGKAVNDQDTRRLIGEGLDEAAQMSQDPRVQQVADALKAGF